MSVKEAMAVLSEALKTDPEYAYAWHANIAMACYDSMDEHTQHEEKQRVGNEAATRFMSLAFDVATSQNMLLRVPYPADDTVEREEKEKVF